MNVQGLPVHTHVLALGFESRPMYSRHLPVGGFCIITDRACQVKSLPG